MEKETVYKPELVKEQPACAYCRNQYSFTDEYGRQRTCHDNGNNGCMQQQTH